ncbi:DUF1236 domain-containing protein (plasmid) [Phyllobacterium sp. A18/5-2]|uniref:DUF1236 domain-containing protein n=1 Tax=Phyllobacterium sp. A18/5-2 TaxID=2978392 RepID=UPI0021C8799A|nr:DUF1236 domain-containing protein [Phyllobacterium sp. A18/5-2]UXN66273.1 DUF1236 domain-containing protein [Phyllobacterium sp. A18/5-2]
MRRILLAMAVMLAASGSAFAQDAVVIEVPQPARDYVIAHPIDPVVIKGDVAVGAAVSEDVKLVPIPDSPDYGYIHVDKQPVIVTMKDRKVVYMSK